jgi:hypothetical protein
MTETGQRRCPHPLSSPLRVRIRLVYHLSHSSHGEEGQTLFPLKPAAPIGTDADFAEDGRCPVGETKHGGTPLSLSSNWVGLRMAVGFRRGGDLVLVRAKATAGCALTICHEPSRMQDGLQPFEGTQLRKQSRHRDVELFLPVVSAKDHQMEQLGNNGQKPRSTTAQPGDPPVGRFRPGNVQNYRVREINRAPQQAGRVFVGLPPFLPGKDRLHGLDNVTELIRLDRHADAKDLGDACRRQRVGSKSPVGVSKQSLMAVRMAYSRSLVLVSPLCAAETGC